MTLKIKFNKLPDRNNTDCVKYDKRMEIFGYEDVLPMWVADMDFESPDFIKQALKKRMDHNVYGYSFRPEQFGQAAKRWMLKRHRWKIEENQVLFSPGIVPAINFSILAFTKPGDQIMVQTPVYFPFFRAIRDHGRKLIENNLIYKDGHYTIDFNDFETKVRSGVKLFILCSPHNPVGRVWTKEELNKMSNLCEKYGVLIVSDEIHHDIVFNHHKHIPIANLNSFTKHNTITCVSPSKTFNLAGLSTSAIIIQDDKLRMVYEKLFNKFHLEQGNIFGNIAIVEAYQKGEQYVDELTQYLEGNINFITAFFKNHFPEIKPVPTEATYLSWLDFSELKLNPKQINEKLIHEAAVGLSDGRLFGTGGAGFQRLNFATSIDNLQIALNKILHTFKK